MEALSIDPAAIGPRRGALNNRRSSTLANLLAPVDVARRQCPPRQSRCAVRHDDRLLRQITSIGLFLSYGDLFGAAGLGFVWGWLLVQLTVASRPSVQRLILPLFATTALLGTVLVLLDVRAMAACAAATGVAAVLHAALNARLRAQSGSLESFEVNGGEPR